LLSQFINPSSVSHSQQSDSQLATIALYIERIFFFNFFFFMLLSLNFYLLTSNSCILFPIHRTTGTAMLLPSILSHGKHGMALSFLSVLFRDFRGKNNLTHR
jgi:hypothetical protein